jgi:hypothetical protein
MDKEEILQLVNEHKDSFVQMIKARDIVFYSNINKNFPGKSFSEKLYCWSRDENAVVGKCNHCGKETHFLTFREGYRPYCSAKCSNGVNRKEYADRVRIHPPIKNSKYWEEIVCVNCKTKFWALKFRKQRFCSNQCSSKFTANDRERLTKIRHTKLAKYGSETYVNLDKARETCIKKYGVTNPWQANEIKDKIRITFLKRYLIKLKTSDRLRGLVTPLFGEADFVSTFRTNKYKFQCKKCNSIFEDNIDDGRIPRCLTCFPILSGKSHGEMEVVDFLKTGVPCNILSNDRTLLDRKELDIYIPDKNLAIEYDGLFWHSESGGRKPYNYHLNKTIECGVKNVKLIHIFEDEWLYKQDIVKSKLNYILKTGIFDKIYARRCIIREIKYSEMDIFMEDNHLQGSVRSSINIGLFYNDELVSAASFGGLRLSLGQRSSSNSYELLRFATKRNKIVNGGFSKLFKFFIEKYNPRLVISYADRRWSSGDVYSSVGFKCVGETAPNYWYIKNGDLTRYHRFTFRKSELSKKLKIFDPGLSEWENMQFNGYDRIWDCGNLKYEWMPKKSTPL